MATEAGQLFERAAALIREKRVGEAARLLERAAQLDDRHAPSLHLLGLVVGRAGDRDRCVALLSRAVEAGSPEQAQRSGLLLAESCRRWNRLDEAEAAFRGVLARDDASIEGWFGLGLTLRAVKRRAEGISALEQAAALDPGFATAHAALAATLLDAGQLGKAAAAAERALALAPHNVGFRQTVAVVRNAEGRHAEAERLCRDALRHGDDAEAHNTLGVALKAQSRIDEAADCFSRAMVLDPESAEACYNLAAARKDQGRTDDAIALLRGLVERRPSFAAARFALCTAHLPPIYMDEAEIDRRRVDYAVELERLIRWADLHGAGALADGVGTAQPFHLAYQGRNDVDLQRRHGALVCRAMAARHPSLKPTGPPAAGERIRVGFVSGFFRDHSVWRLPTRGWVAGLDRSHFEVTGYHTTASVDAETTEAERLFDRFVQGPLPLKRWLALLARDRPHVLVYPEIGMDPMVARLAALRLAPLQAVSWGHPTTSGYPTMDMFLSSDAMEPKGADRHYSERLVRLSGLSTSFDVAYRPTAGARLTFGLPTDAILYWCGQSLYKYLPRHDHLLADIARRVPCARFIFVAFPGSSGPTQLFRQRLRRAFGEAGLDEGRHCLFLPPMDANDYRSVLGCADVALDNPGWSGCNSLVEAIREGLPIVALAGNLMRARHGPAILGALGNREWICANAREYVDCAVRLGLDPDYRAVRREQLLRTMPISASEAVDALQDALVQSLLAR